MNYISSKMLILTCKREEISLKVLGIIIVYIIFLSCIRQINNIKLPSRVIESSLNHFH